MFNVQSRRRLLAVPLATMALLVAACGSSSSGRSSATNTPSSSSPTGGNSNQLSNVEATVQKYEGIPSFTPPGPSFDASKAKGKSIFYISLSTSNAFQNSVTSALQQAAAAVGVNFFSYPNTGQVSQYVSGMEEAIQRHPDLIMLGSITPDLIMPQINAARQAGIAVMATHQANPDSYPPGTLGSLPTDYKSLTSVVYGPFIPTAQLEADYVIAASNGKANVLLMTASNIAQSAGIVAAIKDELSSKCPSGCSVTTVDTPSTSWASNLENQTQSSLTANPDVNYIIPIYDSMTSFVVPGVEAAGKGSAVKVVSYNGTPSVLTQMESSPILAADVGENPMELGLLDMDQALRILTGQPTNPAVPEELRIFTQQNVKDAGTPAVAGQGYGTAWQSGFAELWGLPSSTKL